MVRCAQSLSIGLWRRRRAGTEGTQMLAPSAPTRSLSTIPSHSLTFFYVHTLPIRFPPADPHQSIPVCRSPSVDFRLPIPSAHSLQPIPVCRSPSVDSRLPISISRFPSSDSRLPIPISRFPSADPHQSIHVCHFRLPNIYSSIRKCRWCGR